MDLIYQDIDEGRLKKSSKIIKRMKNCLHNDGDINLVFFQKNPFIRRMQYRGSILHYLITKGYSRIVKYALSKGANIECEMTSNNEKARWRNVMETVSILDPRRFNRNSIFEMLKQRCLELYSSYGLTPLHLNCAIHLGGWSNESVQDLQSAEVNAAVCTESPMWPGMTPLLIAAIFSLSKQLINCLLQAGADPLVRDPKGYTPLHYWYRFCRQKDCDKRLFSNNGSNLFGSYNGESHFHIACRTCPSSLEIVQRYLDQGISPDLPGPGGWIGLHYAATVQCPELIQLLLEFGAEVNREDSDGRTPLRLLFDRRPYDESMWIQCICVFIEASANVEKVEMEEKFLKVLNESVSRMLVFLKCIVRLIMLNEKLVSIQLMKFYLEKSVTSGCLPELNQYTVDCSEELKAFPDPELRRILDGTAVVKADFGERFRWLDFKSYPIYGSMLKIKTKRKLLEYEKKRRVMPRAVTLIQSLLESVCYLPHLCAENILWNLSVAELNQFAANQK